MEQPNTPIEWLEWYKGNPFAWPGGYTLCAVMDDGELLCHSCTVENFDQIREDTETRGTVTGWRFQWLMDVDNEDREEDWFCAHCGKIVAEKNI